MCYLLLFLLVLWKIISFSSDIWSIWSVAVAFCSNEEEVYGGGELVGFNTLCDAGDSSVCSLNIISFSYIDLNGSDAFFK